ncbi:hypothetical protein Y032_0014g2465 [Ancylostoma ceylanicum]|uniref:Uncharacterized protein n=1 Tax=Ancylostoma ceylanicum TaxID=53326 RepID=A0A016VCA0_9BILA|nr:hypothetical protein Y032_0014g2465 [Ancylostoma ceylanicum]
MVEQGDLQVKASCTSYFRDLVFDIISSYVQQVRPECFEHGSAKSETSRGRVVIEHSTYIQSFQKIPASGIHRPSANPCRASYALSYVLRRGSVDAQRSGRQVFFGKIIQRTSMEVRFSRSLGARDSTLAPESLL